MISSGADKNKYQVPTIIKYIHKIKNYHLYILFSNKIYSNIIFKIYGETNKIKCFS